MCFWSVASRGNPSASSTDVASEITDGMDGFDTDIDTAEPKSEELETIAGGICAMLFVVIVWTRRASSVSVRRWWRCCRITPRNWSTARTVLVRDLWSVDVTSSDRIAKSQARFAVRGFACN
ncbi:hypothetical protein KC359_g49 [Hortaea werneckii]|nr:hypothetical protein KC359_g49 [Hortaea werneckii]